MAVARRAAGSLFSANPGTSLSPSSSASSVSGDLLVLVVAYMHGGTTVSTPAGWTLIVQPSNSGANTTGMAIFTKTSVGGAESATVTLGSSQQFAALITTYSGSSGVVAGGQSGSSGGYTAATAPSVTPTVSHLPHGGMLLFASVNSDVLTATPPSGMTEFNDSGSGPLILELADVAYSSASATGTKSNAFGGTAFYYCAANVLIQPTNSTPSAPVVTAPNGGENINASVSVTWNNGTDPDGDTLSYDVDYTRDGGSTWVNLVTGTASLSYAWNTSGVTASAACRVRVRSRDPYGALSAYDESNANFTIAHNQTPTATTSVSPANAVTVDLAAGATFVFTYNDPDTSDTMASYAMRRKITGAGSYEYWNAGTGAWQGTEVFNSLSVAQGANGSVTFASGKWTNGNVYQWAVSARDNAGATGPYPSDFTVTAGAAPAVTVTTPTGTVTDTNQPVVAWTYSDTENDPQANYQVRVFTAAQYGIGGFDPAVSPSTWDSGVVSSVTARNVQVGSVLTNGTSYRAYVRSGQSGSQFSAWAFSAFTVSLTPPGTPVLTVTLDNPNNRVTLAGTWSPAGAFTNANTSFYFEYSDNAGVTWNAVRNGSGLVPNGSNAASVIDQEAAIAAPRSYRARMIGVV